jgi:hypothetical protein
MAVAGGLGSQVGFAEEITFGTIARRRASTS